MAYNTILIKRRTSGPAGAPSTLVGGELAFNESDSTLYYGSNSGVIAIAGNGAFVDRTTSQTIGGDKTFTGLTTLSSVTLSPNSVVNFGGNVLTNLAAPSTSADATTKQYVDDAFSLANSNSNTAVTNLSTEVYNTFVKLTDDRLVTLTGGLDVNEVDVTGNASVGGNLTVTGNLSVLGTQTVINTQTINISGTSTQIDVVNNGTATGITVNQTGSQDVAEFKDDGATALIIKDGGNVGIGTATPNEKLTISGNVSASGTIYGASGLEIADNGGVSTLYVESGKVGINTETPNEELTVVGSISASEDIYAVNGTFTGSVDLGSLDVGCFSVDATGNVDTCGTLSVGGASTFASTVSAQGALTVDGSSTLNSTLDVVGASTFASSVSAQGFLVVDGTSTLNGAVTINNTLNATGAVNFDSTLEVDGAATLNSSLDVGTYLTVTNDISGTASSSRLIDFIIDGGTF